MRTLGSASILLVLLGVLGGVAEAKKPEDIFGGRILVSDKPFPTAAPSENAYVGALKKNSRLAIQEDKQAQEWRIFYAAFFKQPVNDMEVTIRVYDVTGGARRLVDTFEQYVSSQAARAYVSSATLKRGDGSQGYDPNTKILMVVENKGRMLAQTQFQAFQLAFLTLLLMPKVELRATSASAAVRSEAAPTAPMTEEV